MTGDDLRGELERDERSIRWLARKLNVSHTTVARWVRDAEPIPENRREQIAALFNGNGRTHG